MVRTWKTGEGGGVVVASTLELNLEVALTSQLVAAILPWLPYAFFGNNLGRCLEGRDGGGWCSGMKIAGGCCGGSLCPRQRSCCCQSFAASLSCARIPCKPRERPWRLVPPAFVLALGTDGYGAMHIVGVHPQDPPRIRGASSKNPTVAVAAFPIS